MGPVCAGAPGCAGLCCRTLDKNIWRLHLLWLGHACARGLLPYSKRHPRSEPEGYHRVASSSSLPRFLTFSQLSELYVDQKQLAKLLSGTFSDLSHLTKLCLFNNWLRSLPTGHFSDLLQFPELRLASPSAQMPSADSRGSRIIEDTTQVEEVV
jgi:hypothetical protein